MSYIDDSTAQITAVEGSVPFLYLDTRGLVTCAVGQMLPDVAAAEKLPWQDKYGDASIDAILADYGRVKAMKPGLPAILYHCDSSLTLFPLDIAKLLRSRIVGFDGQLRGYFAKYDEFPDCVKLALLDMIFNLGFGGLLKYPTMNKAVNAGDWATAAAECHRKGPSDARNNWTRSQFLAALEVPIEASIPQEMQ